MIHDNDNEEDIVSEAVGGEVETVARAIFAEEQCDRRQKRTAESLEENWLTRLDDRDREEYRALARAAVIDQQQQEAIATDPLSFWPTASIERAGDE